MNLTIIFSWMRVLCLSSIITAAALPAQAWLFGKDHPSKSEITSMINDALPSWIEIEDMDIGSQEIRNGMVEYSETRVKLILKAKSDLYRRVSKYPNNVQIYDVKNPSGSDHETFLLIQAVAKGEGWDGHVEWDNDKFFYEIGRPANKLTGKFYLQDTPEHKAFLADRAAKMEAANAAFAVPLAGVMHCKSSIEIDEMTINARQMSGKIRYRPVSSIVYKWKEAKIEVKRGHDVNSYFVTSAAFDGSFEVKAVNDKPVFTNYRCDIIALHPKGEIPKNVAENRAREEAFLSRLKVGPVTSKAVEGKTLHPVSTEVLKITERGLRIVVDHPMQLNGNLNPNQRSSTVMDVRFTDAPLTVRISSKTSGRGGTMLPAVCALNATFTPEGAMRLTSSERFGCNEMLELVP